MIQSEFAHEEGRHASKPSAHDKAKHVYPNN